MCIWLLQLSSSSVAPTCRCPEPEKKAHINEESVDLHCVHVCVCTCAWRGGGSNSPQHTHRGQTWWRRCSCVRTIVWSLKISTVKLFSPFWEDFDFLPSAVINRLIVYTMISTWLFLNLSDHILNPHYCKGKATMRTTLMWLGKERWRLPVFMRCCFLLIIRYFFWHYNLSVEMMIDGCYYCSWTCEGWKYCVKSRKHNKFQILSFNYI